MHNSDTKRSVDSTEFIKLTPPQIKRAKKKGIHLFARTFTILFIIVFMILAAWDFSSSFTRNAVIAEIEADRHAEATLEANILSCPSQTDNECILRALQSTREYQRAEANLNAQKDMAKWALAMVIISGAGTAVSLLGILFIADTLRATRKGNRINRRIGEAQSRAYLAAVSMKLERTTTTHFKVIVEINNTGITPAWDLRVSCVVRFEQINSGVVVNTFSVPSDENGVLTNHRREHPAAERREPHFNFVITEEQTTAISAGSWRIIGIVEIEYFDVFGKRHIAHPISYIDLQWVGTINHTSALSLVASDQDRDAINAAHDVYEHG